MHVDAEPVRVAVVGYAPGGAVFHAPLVSVTPRLSLDVIVTSHSDRQAAARQRYPGVAVVDGMDELLARAGDLDLAVVTVPNAAHVAVATAALAAGLSVVIDKPVAPGAAEVEAVADMAGALGRLAVPYHNRRWDGDFRTLRRLVCDGAVGEVWRFESRFERWRPAVPDAPSWKHDPSQAAGGILFDLGPHLIDQAVVLFGLPASVYAEMPRRRGALDDDTFVALSYPGGLIVHLWMSSRAAQRGPRFRVLGSEGSYVKWGLDVQEDALRAGHLPTEPGWGEEPPGAWGRLGSDEGAEAVPTLPGAYQDFYRGVAASLLDGAAPPVTMTDAVIGARIIEAVIASAATGTAVTIG